MDHLVHIKRIDVGTPYARGDVYRVVKSGWWVITPWKKKYIGVVLPGSVKRKCKREFAFGFESYRSRYAYFMKE